MDYHLRPATKVDVEYKALAFEVSSEVAATRVHEVSQRLPPSRRIRCHRRDVRRDAGAGKEPDRNPLRRPLRRIRTALNSIEAIAIGLSIRRRLRAPTIAIAIRISKDRSRRRPRIGDRAARPAMQSDNGSFLQIDGLDDIDLPAVGPVGAAGPVGGPDAAGVAGHVGGVGDEEAGGEVVC